MTFLRSVLTFSLVVAACMVKPISDVPRAVAGPPIGPMGDCTGYDTEPGTSTYYKIAADQGFRQCIAHARFVEAQLGMKVDKGTQAVYLTPFAASRRLGTQHIEGLLRETHRGFCQSASYVTSSPYAYRCQSSNEILDPAYRNPNSESFNGPVILAVGGVKEMIELTQALPRNESPEIRPLYVVFTDGTKADGPPSGTLGSNFKTISKLDTSRDVWQATVSIGIHDKVVGTFTKPIARAYF